MKEKLRAKVKEIKDTLPKDNWAGAIKAARAELAEPEKVEVSNLPTVQGDKLTLAEEIMSTDILIRYLRRPPTVGVAIKQADVDAPPVKKRVICAGTPFGVLVAFKYDDKLYVGWSRRHSGRLLRKQQLEGLFKGTITMMQDTRMVSKVSEEQAGRHYEALLFEFTKTVQSFLKGELFDEVEEVPFGKRKGKIAAIGRALDDTLLTTGKTLLSAFSGPLPKDVEKNLSWFIKVAEEKFGMKVSNLSELSEESKNTKALTASVGTTPMVIE